jgi:tetratricopeptide (TPR) repeat protein
MDRLAEAEQHYLRATPILEAALGPDHPKVSTALNNLAGLLRVMQRFDESETIYRRVLRIDEVCYSEDDPEVAIHADNLAGLLEQTHRPEEAQALRHQAVRNFFRFARTAGYEHPSHREAVVKYVNLLMHLGASPQQIISKLELTAEELSSLDQEDGLDP